jgi:hypothetical protein
MFVFQFLRTKSHIAAVNSASMIHETVYFKIVEINEVPLARPGHWGRLMKPGLASAIAARYPKGATGSKGRHWRAKALASGTRIPSFCERRSTTPLTLFWGAMPNGRRGHALELRRERPTDSHAHARPFGMARNLTISPFCG